jgi:hypothetical protein
VGAGACAFAPIDIKTHMVNAHMINAHLVNANVRIACRIIDASRSVSRPASRSRDGGRNATRARMQL